MVVNDDSYDYDFRVESDANSHAFFVDGSTNKVGFNTASPATVSGGIHAVHNAGEGTPTAIGSEVGIFQRNAVAAQSVAVSLISGTASTASIYFGDKDDIDAGKIDWSNSSNNFSFSGGDLVWHQAPSSSASGIAFNNTTHPSITVSGGSDTAFRHRMLFVNGNGTVGSISSVPTGSGSIVIGNDNSGIMFRGDLTTSAFIPANPANGAQVDNTLDIGHAAIRFDDIYATNGSIQTSDRNEKQDIAELSDAEQRVAVACKGLLRKFRWKDSVAEKGDDARTHFGIIAQDLQAAFEAEGLDAGDYAMFISTTWTDEETNEEQTRLGVRYSQLLAFIITSI